MADTRFLTKIINPRKKVADNGGMLDFSPKFVKTG
jgi:hypothetical protein